MGEPGLPQKVFAAVRASVWTKNKGGGGGGGSSRRAPPLDPPLKRISVQLTTTAELALIFV